MFMRGMQHRMGIDEGDDLGRLYDHQVVLRLLVYVRHHSRQMSLAIVAILVYTITVVSLPWLVKLIIDDYITDGADDLSGLTLVVSIFVLVALIQYVTNYVHLRSISFVGQRVLFTLRVNLFKHIQRLPMSFFDRNEVGKVMSRVQNDVQQLQEFLSILVLSLADVLSLGGIIVAMLVMDVRLALITLLVVPLLFVTLFVWQRYARGSFVRVRRAIAVVNSELQENITGIRVVQSLNREQQNIRRFKQSNRDHLDANLQAGRYSAVLMPSVEVLTALGLSLVVFFGGSMVLNNSLEVGVLVAFALYIQRFFDPVRNLTMQYAQLQRAMASGARIFELLDIKPEIVDRPNTVQLDRVRGEVHYQNVNFCYIEGTPVLQDINLDINPGEIVALVGPTGSGKTTLMSLLLRFYDVTGGRITVDGHDIRDVSLNSLSRQMSVVTQEPFLFSGTVEDNIRYNRSEATHEDVVRAAIVVGVHEFINKLECGYDTLVRERGVNLSVGQRQLISFARAVVADPRILILDEATANIDTHSEILIQRALGQLLQNRTALVIAHRLSTIRNADRIVAVDGGRIIEQGTHSELMRENGLYARLHSYTVYEQR